MKELNLKNKSQEKKFLKHAEKSYLKYLRSLEDLEMDSLKDFMDLGKRRLGPPTKNSRGMPTWEIPKDTEKQRASIRKSMAILRRAQENCLEDLWEIKAWIKSLRPKISHR